MEHLIYNLFAYPSAWLTAVFHGAGMERIPGGDIWINLSSRAIHVTPACSGFGFFTLLCLYALVFVIRRSARPFRGKMVLAVIPAAYLTTVFANATRMICAYHVAHLSRMLFPVCFQAVIHMAVGIAVFFSVLILSHLFLQRILPYGK